MSADGPFTAVRTAMTATDEEILNHKYERGKALGEGGAGRAYEALHVELGRKVALKFPRSDVVDPMQVTPTFTNLREEARKAARIDHANVASPTDMGWWREADGSLSYCIVMPLYEGTLEDKTFSVPEAADWSRQIALGLCAIHKTHLVHGDLKPSNIFLQGERPLIGDFGSAVHIEEVSEVTPCWVTHDYLSPERIRGGGRSQAADIWSLGIVIYELSGGKNPYAGWQTRAAARAAVLSDAPLCFPADFQAPELLRDVIQKCCQKDPRRRPTAKEVADLMTRLLKATERSSSLRRWVRRHKGKLLTAVTALTLLTCRNRVALEVEVLPARLQPERFATKILDRGEFIAEDILQTLRSEAARLAQLSHHAGTRRLALEPHVARIQPPPDGRKGCSSHQDRQLDAALALGIADAALFTLDGCVIAHSHLEPRLDSEHFGGWYGFRDYIERSRVAAQRGEEDVYPSATYRDQPDGAVKVALSTPVIQQGSSTVLATFLEAERFFDLSNRLPIAPLRTQAMVVTPRDHDKGQPDHASFRIVRNTFLGVSIDDKSGLNDDIAAVLDSAFGRAALRDMLLPAKSPAVLLEDCSRPLVGRSSSPYPNFDAYWGRALAIPIGGTGSAIVVVLDGNPPTSDGVVSPDGRWITVRCPTAAVATNE